MMRLHRPCDLVLRIVLGIVFGYLAKQFIYDGSTSASCQARTRRDAAQMSSSGRQRPPATQDQPPAKKELVFVGVMTAQKYLDTRAISVYRTWGRKLPGKIAFFSRAGSKSSFADLDGSIVSLRGVDDSYPPQKKSFLMLKYMHDHLLDDYEWFMRADDDVYVRGDRLEDFLRSLNSSKPLFIGQAGMGNKEEFGMLSLAPGENFCMGGPGIIMSRETLRRVAPHIQYCLKHLYSTHEDVEIGRCIKRFAGVPCAWSYEMQTIFYHNQSGSDAFTSDLHVKEVHRAITLHPVKTSQHLYRIQNYFSSLSLAELRHDTILLQRDVYDMKSFLPSDATNSRSFPEDLAFEKPTLNRFRPGHPDEVLEWEFFTKSFFSHLDLNPRRALRSSLRWALNDLIMQMMELINQYSKQRGRVIDYRDLLYGYQRVDPLHGVHYILDLHLVYKRYSGRKMTAPVRRHAYLEQSFAGLQMVEEEDCVGTPPVLRELERDFAKKLRYFSDRLITDGDHRVSLGNSTTQIINALMRDDVTRPAFLHSEKVDGSLADYSPRMRLDFSDPNCHHLSEPETINFIVPISGRFETLQRFLDVMEKVCFSKKEKVTLTIVRFIESQNSGVDELLATVRSRNPSYRIDAVDLEGSFSRARALHSGAMRFPLDGLLFFVDVDMVFDQLSLGRIRKSTKLRQMAYYPIVFSQYEPQTLDPLGGSLDFSEDSGYWRQFGYGIASMYRADFDAVGGFDLNITGWGKEDVDLFEKFLKLAGDKGDGSFEVFRSVDPGLVHIYHSIVCDSSLDAPQLIMCLGSKAASIAGERRLTQKILLSLGAVS